MADHRNRRNRNYDHAAADMDYSISTSWFVLCLDFHSKYLPRVTHGIEKYVNSMFCVLPNRWGLNDRVRYAFSRPIIRVAFKTFTRWKDRNSSAPITSAERWQRTLSGICSERSAYRAACINAFSLSGTVVVRAHTSATSPTVYSLRPLHLSLSLSPSLLFFSLPFRSRTESFSRSWIKRVLQSPRSTLLMLIPRCHAYASIAGIYPDLS